MKRGCLQGMAFEPQLWKRNCETKICETRENPRVFTPETLTAYATDSATTSVYARCPVASVYATDSAPEAPSRDSTAISI